MALNCPQCGYQNLDGALFCNLCQAVFKPGQRGVSPPAAVSGLAPDAPAGSPAPPPPVAAPAPGAGADLAFSFTENIWLFEVQGTRERLEVKQRMTTLYTVLGGIFLLFAFPFAIWGLATVFSHPLRLIGVGLFLLCAAGVGGRSGVILVGPARLVKGWSSFFGWRIEHEDRHIGPLDTVTVTREWRQNKHRRWEVFAVRIKTGGEEIDVLEGHSNTQTVLALADLAGVLLGIKVEKNLAAE